MDIKNNIKFYSKKGCSPCDWTYQLFEARFREKNIEKIIFDTDDEALEVMKNFNTTSVPFIVIDGRIAIPSRELNSLLYAMNVCPKSI